jgi:hypothetical protein|tara:strand:- start:212 stop:1225 length:1014 start_codon:yes stop_codon:yes gene_type:complete
MIKVKLYKKGGAQYFERQFPKNDSNKLFWQDIEFTLDHNCQEYDWLCMIDRGYMIDKVNCNPANTIFIATEPSSITYYGQNFAKQFGYLLSNQSPKNLPHKNAIRQAPGSHWFYAKNYCDIINHLPYKKTKIISAIATHKVEHHTCHYLRFKIIQKLSLKIKLLDVLYSRKDLAETFQESFPNAKFVNDKIAMLDDYKYHIAIGNELGKDILTERVTDAFLAFCVPIVWGCTNMSDYFPKQSYIEIDINKPDEAIKIITDIINNKDDYNNRLKYVIQAREMVLNKYNLISILANIIKNHDGKMIKKNKYILSRRLIRILYPRDLFGFLLFKIRNFLK